MSAMIEDTESPYDVLAPAGVTPQSSMREIRGAIGYFTRKGAVETVQNAWNTLIVVEDRLLIDFFLYRDRSAAQEAAGEERHE